MQEEYIPLDINERKSYYMLKREYFNSIKNIDDEDINIETIKVELNILNSLIGSKCIEYDFENIIRKYPETIKCIPLLLARLEMVTFIVKIITEDIYMNFTAMNFVVMLMKNVKSINIL